MSIGHAALLCLPAMSIQRKKVLPGNGATSAPHMRIPEEQAAQRILLKLGLLQQRPQQRDERLEN
eukprot:11837177-Karenia_brevis.AAC.1